MYDVCIMLAGLGRTRKDSLYPFNFRYVDVQTYSQSSIYLSSGHPSEYFFAYGKEYLTCLAFVEYLTYTLYHLSYLNHLYLRVFYNSS
jgi:hypothetical protein